MLQNPGLGLNSWATNTTTVGGQHNAMTSHFNNGGTTTSLRINSSLPSPFASTNYQAGGLNSMSFLPTLQQLSQNGFVLAPPASGNPLTGTSALQPNPNLAGYPSMGTANIGVPQQAGAINGSTQSILDNAFSLGFQQEGISNEMIQHRFMTLAPQNADMFNKLQLQKSQIREGVFNGQIRSTNQAKALFDEIKRLQLDILNTSAAPYAPTPMAVTPTNPMQVPSPTPVNLANGVPISPAMLAIPQPLAQPVPFLSDISMSPVNLANTLPISNPLVYPEQEGSITAPQAQPNPEENFMMGMLSGLMIALLMKLMKR